MSKRYAEGILILERDNVSETKTSLKPHPALHRSQSRGFTVKEGKATGKVKLLAASSFRAINLLHY